MQTLWVLEKKIRGIQAVRESNNNVALQKGLEKFLYLVPWIIQQGSHRFYRFYLRRHILELVDQSMENIVKPLKMVFTKPLHSLSLRSREVSIKASETWLVLFAICIPHSLHAAHHKWSKEDVILAYCQQSDQMSEMQDLQSFNRSSMIACHWPNLAVLIQKVVNSNDMTMSLNNIKMPLSSCTVRHTTVFLMMISTFVSSERTETAWTISNGISPATAQRQGSHKFM